MHRMLRAPDASEKHPYRLAVMGEAEAWER